MVKAVVAAQSADNTQRWREAFQRAWPEAQFHAWAGRGSPSLDAPYAIVWRPPAELFLHETALKAVFNLGAGVDSLLQMPELPPSLPVVRLEDAGMAAQMTEYVVYGLVRASRGFDRYEAAQGNARWRQLPAICRDDWPVGVMGMGAMGAEVARVVARLGYPVAGWSRSARRMAGVENHVGQAGLAAFLSRTRVLVNLLPLTPDTENILNYRNLSRLLAGGYLINVARGQHLVEDDLLTLLDEGRIAGAMLDVFRSEPLPSDHPFWHRRDVIVTPHVAAITLQSAAVAQVVGKIRDLERGVAVSGVVDRDSGY